MPHYRNGRHIIVAMLLSAIIIGGGLLPRHCTSATTGDNLSDAEIQELAIFNRQMQQRSAADSLRHRHLNRQQVPETFPFNPNTADSATLLRLGLRPWQIRNLMKYRNKGGKWRSSDDFSRLYGLSDKDFKRLRPFIRIDKEPNGHHTTEDTAKKTTRHFPQTEKYAEGTVIDLNKADTTMLKHIPGIGSYYAGKICRYRERLGGFVSAHQIKEVEGLPQGIERWFVIEMKPELHRMNVNEASFRQLVRHPYLNYEQVKIIFDYRRKYGRLKSWNDLQLYNEFSTDHIQKLLPYFTF